MEQSKTAPWLLFEAGALSKAVESSHVVPLLFDLKASDVENPLGQFQARSATHDGMHALLTDINQATGSPMESVRLEAIFEVWWPTFDNARQQISEASVEAEPVKVAQETPRLLEEILEAVRAQQRILASPELLLPIEYLREA